MYINKPNVFINLNDGFMLCVDENEFVFIRDFNLNKINKPYKPFFSIEIMLKFNYIFNYDNDIYVGKKMGNVFILLIVNHL